MAGVDGSPPYACAYERENTGCDTPATAYGSVDGRYEHVCGMKRRYGGEHIGVLAVKGMEHGNACQQVEASESGDVARSVEYWLKTVVHGIPRGSGRMNVIADKTGQDKYRQ